MKDKIISWVIWVFIGGVIVLWYMHFFTTETVAPEGRTLWEAGRWWFVNGQESWANTRIPWERAAQLWRTGTWEIVRGRPNTEPFSNSWITATWSTWEDVQTLSGAIN